MIVLKITKRRSEIFKVSFAPDGTSIRLTMSTGGGPFKHLQRNLTTGEQIDFPPLGLGYPFCDHPKSEWIFGAREAGIICGYQTTQKTLVTVETPNMFCSPFAVTPNRLVLLFSWSRLGIAEKSGYGSLLWIGERFESGFTKSDDRYLTRSGQSLTCFGLASLPDNERFVALNWRWDIPTVLSIRSVFNGEILNEKNLGDTGRPSLALSPCGKLIVVMETESVYIFLLDELSQPLHTLKTERIQHFTGVAFHPSGRLLGVTSNDTTVKFYDTETWAVTSTFNWDIGKLRSIAFSNDGTLAAAGSDTGKVVIWDVDL